MGRPKRKRSSAFKNKCRNPLHESWGHAASAKLKQAKKLNSDQVLQLQEVGCFNIKKIISQNGHICEDCISTAHAKTRFGPVVSKDHQYHRNIAHVTSTARSVGSGDERPSTSSGSGTAGSAASTDEPHRAEENSPPTITTPSPKPTDDIEDTIERIVSLISSDALSQNLLQKLIVAIASLMKTEIIKDVQSQAFSRPSKCAEKLKGLPAIEDWLSQRSRLVTLLLDELAKKNLDPIAVALSNRSASNRYKEMKALELIYNLVQSNLISPYALAENLVTYSLSNSQLVTDMNGHSGPAGSYWYLRTWMNEESKVAQLIPNGDVVVAFDNDQVIGKSYHVKPNNKVSSSVVTSVCSATLDSSIQLNGDLLPGKWTQDIKVEAIEAKMEASHDEKRILATELLKTLNERLAKVKAEQNYAPDGSLTDKVDSKVDVIRESREHVTCLNCSIHNSLRAHKCRGCKASLRGQNAPATVSDAEEPPAKKRRQRKGVFTEITISTDGGLMVMINDQWREGQQSSMHGHIPTNNVHVQMQACDPVFLNPNSHERVKEVLRHIGKLVGIQQYVPEGAKKWCAVVCDGLPYVLALKVIRETLICECGSLVEGKSALSQHQEENGHPHASSKREFDWVLLQIGLGHVEMNLARSYLELNWAVFMSEVAWCMGFRSEAAQKYAKKGSDHHKTWELLRATYLGTIDELLLPYVRECIEQNLEPSGHDYLSRWCQETLNPKYEYMHLQVMTYLHALMVFRGGLRCNNASYISAGMVRLSDIVHGRNHPKYQSIMLVERANKLLAPPDMKKFLEFQTVSYSGDPYKGEAMDFQLERYNKASKVWLPRGVPTNADWQKVFRLLDRLDGVKKCTEKLMQVNQAQHDTATSHEPDDETVLAWRVHLRESNYLAHPKSGTEIHSSISGEELDAQLMNMAEIARYRRIFHMRNLFESGYPTPSIHETPHPVFVTVAEREEFCKITNKTIDMIKLLILELIDQLDSDIVQAHYRDAFKRVKNKKKEDIVTFYEKVKEEVEEQMPLSNLLE